MGKDMNSNIKFSVVIPLYNKENYIVDCINSINSQTYRASEIIIINDGSTDNSLEKINSLKNNIENLIVLDKTNGGEASSRNMGIENSNCEYIAFLDADDFWLSNHLEQLKELIVKYPECELYCSQYYAISRAKEKKKMKLPDIGNNNLMVVNNYFEYLYKGYGFVNSSNSCVRKNIFKKIDLFKVMNLGTDFDMWCRITEKYELAVFFKESVQINLNAENRVSLKFKNEIPLFMNELKKRIENNTISSKKQVSAKKFYNQSIAKYSIHLMLTGSVFNSKELFKKRMKINTTNNYERCMNIIVLIPDCVLKISIDVLQRVGFIDYLYGKSYK
jgi:glycosyltransferase involved in cell wall biosynthesis